MPSDLMAIVSCDSYGHDAKVSVNGVDLGFAPGKFSASKLFTKDHEMYSKASPDVKAKNFCLKPGENKIEIKYSRLPSAEPFALKVKAEAMGYPAPLLVFETKKDAGKISASFNISEAAPAGFKTVNLTQ